MQAIENLSELVGEYILVDFGASWCRPCKQLSPKLDAIVESYPHVKFFSADVDTVEGIDVKSLPTVRIMHNGNILSEHIGGAAYDDIVKALNDIPRTIQINNDF